VLTERLYGFALTNPTVFRRVVRPLLYQRCGGNAEEVHELAIRLLRGNEAALQRVATEFDYPDLHLDIAGRSRMPFGTAAGFDKDGEALYPLSLVFGFEEPGTVVLHRRVGNPRPRVAVDASRRELYNAQGFPSKGAENFVANASKYRERGGEAPLLVSICGVPPSVGDIEAAHSDMDALVRLIGPYADGFVWNPYSPNTEALKLLRTIECFRRTAELLKSGAGMKLKLVKMGPFDDAQAPRAEWASLVRAWIEGGGDGVVATNAYSVPRAQVPSGHWGYDWAGRSGTFLHPYRDRAIREARKEFPDAFIIATGGIDSGTEAWRCFEAGADLLEGYTPYTFEGFGLVAKVAKELRALLRQRGYGNLAEFVRRR
jgi:dihydroorotate dehydrogenase